LNRREDYRCAGAFVQTIIQALQLVLESAAFAQFTVNSAHGVLAVKDSRMRSARIDALRFTRIAAKPTL
jgi:hypothetical protein